MRRNREKGAAVVAAGNEERRQAVLSLKNSLAAVREEVALKADLYRQTQKQKKEMHEKEFQDLLEQVGGGRVRGGAAAGPKGRDKEGGCLNATHRRLHCYDALKLNSPCLASALESQGRAPEIL